MAATERKRVAIGIDLGTTNSCVAAWKHDKIEIIPNREGYRTTPSCVAFDEEDQLVGDAAKNQCHLNAANTIFGFKRLMGREYLDEFVKNQLNLWPFNVISGEGGRPKIVVKYKDEQKELSAEEMSTMILQYMKITAEKYLGSTISDAVITVPANFSDTQRRATKDAGEAAGLNVLLILNEPAAAAIAYDLTEASWSDGSRNVLIFDLGGGTFDVSILRMEGLSLHMKATAGDTRLGGEDFDERMVNFLVTQFNKKNECDMSKNPKALSRLKSACEKAKRILSLQEQTAIVLDFLHQGIDFQFKFSRSKFEQLNKDLFSRCIEILKEILLSAKMRKSDIDDVVLVGGSTRIPKIKELLEEFFQGNKLRETINPDEAVAYGAAVQAAKLVGLGNQKMRDLVLVDVTPLSIGISGASEEMLIIIPRNTPTPVKREARFSNADDNQTMIPIRVYEGERRLAPDNNFLVEFNVGPLPPARAGQTKFVLGMEVDASGILSVWAEHRESGFKKNVSIGNLHGRKHASEIGKTIVEADTRRLEDEQRAEKYWNRSHLKMLIDNGLLRMRDTKTPNLTNTSRKTLEDEIKKADEWWKGNQEAGALEFLKKWEELEQKLCQYIDLSNLTISKQKYRPAN